MFLLSCGKRVADPSARCYPERSARGAAVESHTAPELLPRAWRTQLEYRFCSRSAECYIHRPNLFWFGRQMLNGSIHRRHFTGLPGECDCALVWRNSATRSSFPAAGRQGRWVGKGYRKGINKSLRRHALVRLTQPYYQFTPGFIYQRQLSLGCFKWLFFGRVAGADFFPWLLRLHRLPRRQSHALCAYLSVCCNRCTCVNKGLRKVPFLSVDADV